MSIFTRAKHWQLFGVIFGAMIAPSYLLDSKTFYLSEVLQIIFMLGLMGWVWTVGYGCNKLLPEDLKKSSLPMTIAVAYAAIYSVFFTFTFSTDGGVDMASLMPFHIAATGCMFYSLGYTARRLVTLQRKEAVGFFDYSGPFFMLWFFPIGVWFIQPRVNELLGNENV